MERPDPYKRRLDKLECPFLWLSDKDGTVENVEVIIRNTKLCMEQSPSLRRPAIGLLSYLYTLNSTKTDLKMALDNIGSAKEMGEDASADFVLRANELHIKDLFEGEQDEEALTRLEEEWSKRESRPKWEAAVWGAKGYAMSRVGPSKYDEGKESFQKAIDLDPGDDYWNIGKAILLERQRRLNKGTEGKPSDEELALLRTANELTDYKNAQYTSYYGHALAEAGKEKKECLQVLTSGMQFAGDDQLIYWKAAKIYKKFGMYNEQKQCLLNGVGQCKFKDRLYHALGNMFWRNKDSQLDDLPKARDYLKKCIEEVEPGQEYYWVEMDLLSIEIKLDPSFNPLHEYHRLGTKYRNSNVFMINLHKQKGYYFLKNSKTDRAIKEFLTAVNLESSQVHGHVSSVRLEIEKCLKHRIETREGMREMTDLAWFYQHCQPETESFLLESAKWYHKILNSTPSEFIMANLGWVLLRLNKYKEAIEVMDTNCVAIEIQKLLSEAFLKSAEHTESSDEKEHWFRKGMALGCKNGAVGLFDLLKSKVIASSDFRSSVSLFTDCAAISLVFENPVAFVLETKPSCTYEQFRDGVLPLVTGSGIDSSLTTLRKLRYEMSRKPDDKKLIEQVLGEARRQLDISHKQLGIKHFPKGKRYCYFPLAVTTGNTDKEKVKKELARLIQTSNHGGWANFGDIQRHKFEPLLDFLAEKQLAGCQWLGGWFDLINIHKHERELTREDYKLKLAVDPLDPNAIGDPLDLAHKAAEFTECVVDEYLKYM